MREYLQLVRLVLQFFLVLHAYFLIIQNYWTLAIIIIAMRAIITSILCIPLMLAGVRGLDYDQAIDPHDPKLRIEQNHYLDFPVMRKDFANWQTVGAAVLLKSKAVLAPEVKDKKGILYSTLPNPLSQNWIFDVEFDIGNT